MKYILIKAGERYPSGFSDLKELINYQGGPQVGFFTLFRPGIRLIRNTTTNDPDCAFCLAHFMVNPALSQQHPLYVTPVRTRTLTDAADRYDYVIVGMVTPTSAPSEHQTLPNVKYISRTDSGNLIDVISGEQINTEDNTTHVTTLFGFVRLKGLPVYTMIINTELMHMTDGVDYLDEPHGIFWQNLSERDGTVAQHLLTPHVAGGTIVGTTIVAGPEDVCISPFGETPNAFRGEDLSAIFSNADYTIDCHFEYDIVGSDIFIKVPPASVGVFHLKFNCGRLFEIASPEEVIELKYVIVRA